MLEVGRLEGVGHTPAVRTAKAHEMVSIRVGALCGGSRGPQPKEVGAENALFTIELTLQAYIKITNNEPKSSRWQGAYK